CSVTRVRTEGPGRRPREVVTASSVASRVSGITAPRSSARLIVTVRC
ncbi:MAG: hypothetical protein AVDCRST_MAG32-1327, partial [uncultured Nocardioides sp.]